MPLNPEVYAQMLNQHMYDNNATTTATAWINVSIVKPIPAKDNKMPTPARKGFKFGCDPELFVKDDKGRYVSAEGLIPGTKESPYPVDRGAVQVDGMAAEFNIEPASSFEDFDRNITTVMAQLKGMLPKGYTLAAVPAVRFDPDIYEAAPHKAKELGCSPDFNAWTGGVNPPPQLTDDPYLRTASGHLHIGWREGGETAEIQHVMNCRDFVKQLDWYLGGWSLQMDPDPTRRTLYGRAGACRYKPYGVEYRVLSNFWITTKLNRLNVWNRMQEAIEMMQYKFIPDKVPNHFSDELQSSINKSKFSNAFLSTFNYPLKVLDQRLSHI